MFNLQDLQKKVLNRISEYVEFDIREIFDEVRFSINEQTLIKYENCLQYYPTLKGDYITIFGGAIRDSLADLEIHDVDILCMPNSALKLRHFLKEKHNYQSLNLYDLDTIVMYKDISLISEPWTLMNDNKKIIQIIRPTWKQYSKRDPKSSVESYKEAYQDLIKNVDISSCGVFLDKIDGELKLKEACKNAIIDCLSKCFEINEWSKLYNNTRTLIRKDKLEKRDWFYLEKDPFLINKKKIKKIERRRKLYTLEFKPEYEFRIWK